MEEFDFYSLCAHYWGITRWQAKTRVIEWFYYAPYNEFESCISAPDHKSPFVLVNPKTLGFVPIEVRAEMLARRGIILGDT